MGHVRKRPVFAGVIGLLCMIWVSSPSIAADPVNLEGTWKISAPQSAFKAEGGSIPFTAGGRKRYLENKKLLAAGKFEDFDYHTARCASAGLPRLALSPERFRIWQRPKGLILMQFERNRMFRQIDMGTLIPQFRVSLGTEMENSGRDDLEVGRAVPISKGHWDGDTLVVTSENFRDNTLIDEAVPHGPDMKLTERIRLRDANTLEDRIRIEDPEYFTKPWETVVTYTRQADEAFPESVCLDSLPHLR